GAQIGSVSAASATNTWYRLELSVATNASNIATTAALQIDGASIASGSTGSSHSLATIRLGFTAAPGASIDCHIDDIAINDSTGANQNSFPGAGSVVLLVPVSDNARGANWVAGAGGTTSLFDAVN